MNSQAPSPWVAIAILVSTACAAPATPPGPSSNEERVAGEAGEVPLVVTPRAVNMGRIRPGAGHSRKIEARAVAAGTVITGASVDGPRFSIEETAASPRRATFSMRFEGRSATGPLAADIRVGYRDAAGVEGAITVPVVGSVAGDLRVARGVYLHRRDGRYQPRILTVGRRSGRSVRIDSVEDPDGLLRVALTEPVGKPASLRLEVKDPDRQDDGRTGHGLLLHVDDEREPVVHLEYRIDAGGR